MNVTFNQLLEYFQPVSSFTSSVLCEEEHISTHALKVRQSQKSEIMFPDRDLQLLAYFQ